MKCNSCKVEVDKYSFTLLHRAVKNCKSMDESVLECVMKPCSWNAESHRYHCNLN